MDSRVGYRFQPTPEELVNHFLKKKRLDPAFTYHDIKDLNIYEHHPCELPDLLFQSDKQVGYFFCILDQKYAKSGRVKRTAKGGSWKITGRDLKVKAKHTDKLIGFKKTLVFYKGSNCKKENRTNWVMHEYHAYHEGHHNKKPVFKTLVFYKGCNFVKGEQDEIGSCMTTMRTSRTTATNNLFSKWDLSHYRYTKCHQKKSWNLNY